MTDTPARQPDSVPAHAVARKPTSEWDEAAARPEHYTSQAQYIHDFLTLADIRDGESVIDIGCGPGTLALPLARAGHRVCAIDFSEGMIDALGRAIRAAHDERGEDLPITPVIASWDDDWSALGVKPADVVLASRSVLHSDMDGIVSKMTAFARRRAALTITELGTPREDGRLLALFGRELRVNPDYVAILEALRRKGFDPQVERIVSFKRDTYADVDAAVQANAKVLGVAGEAELATLHEYLGKHLNAGREADGSPCVRKDYERPITWAFIAWDVAYARRSCSA